jgi:hypothetical protein
LAHAHRGLQGLDVAHHLHGEGQPLLAHLALAAPVAARPALDDERQGRRFQGLVEGLDARQTTLGQIGDRVGHGGFRASRNDLQRR